MGSKWGGAFIPGPADVLARVTIASHPGVVVQLKGQRSLEKGTFFVSTRRKACFHQLGVGRVPLPFNWTINSCGALPVLTRARFRARQST